ncbi:hypothetical protein FA592_04220 [Sulfurospirillum diekertiae]|uniref:Uncharacterized protein n=1 Tax=Sulfurospirillum diekertiae TaxID=1854492 RepID=A0A6G9VQ42_9BACT|nr:hypothetical protein [Sulfurospirillum diekertiae]QIR75469.1 hypothetical protein FA584_04315 [Sulfurospirillum diekertiae]QIR78119.1 hypothetical protein FA592_04220 [Sulfurospirillum diekertiae]
MVRLILIGIAFLLAGCGPRYVIKNEYIPPASALSQTCLNNCSHIRQGCQNQCQQNYQYCLDDAYAKAKAVEVSEQRAYEIAYSRYQMDYTEYQFALQRWQRDYYDYSRDLSHYQSQCERDKDGYACKKRDELHHYLNRLSHDRPREPWVPVRPTFEQILVNQQSFCTTNCGCELSYDNCFVGCGGQVIPHKICVENCD